MNKTIAGALITMLASPLGWAEVTPGAMYPYLAPDSSNCNYVLVHPENSGDVYRSQDCETVFVTPPAEGEVKVRALSVSASKRTCRAYITNEENALNMDKMLARDLQNLLALNLPIGDPKRVELERLIRDTQDQTARLRSTYKTIRGATAQISYNSGFDQNYVNDWIISNLQVFQDKGIRFVKAPIAESFLTFTSVRRGSTESDGVVLSTSVPGIKSNLDARGETILMGETASGQIVLGVAGVCEATADLQGDGLVKVGTQDLASHLVALRTYTVPVKSAAGYTASLNIRNALSLFSKHNLTKGQFQIKDIMTLIGSGSSNDVFTFEIDGFEMPDEVVTDQAKADFYSTIRSDVQSDFAARLTERMLATGVIQVAKAQTSADAVNGGTSHEPGIRTACRRRRSLGGLIDHGQTCWNETYMVPVWNDGVSDRITHQEDNTEFTITDKVRVNAIIYRTHTQSYVEKKPAQAELQ